MFNIEECKPIKVPILVGAKLFVDQCPKTHEEEEDMFHVTNSSVIGCLTYQMVYTRPHISHALGVFSSIFQNQGRSIGQL
jgi:hypothetical protein